jgi:cell division septation protein DedD
MSDEGFHEIQLNGKQLVFLFMAATVVSVVIFLCGVMVGRGVRDQLPAAVAASGSGEAAPESTAAGAPASEPAPVSTPAVTEAPPDPGEGYHGALTAEKPGDEKLAPAPAPQPAAREARVAAEPPPVETPKPREPTRAAAPASPAEVTSGDGFVVQVAALRDRTEADALVRRLSGKGYSAFVVNPVPGKPPVYKVQVGRFADRGDATRISARLKAEEQFSPWVTR